MVEETEKRIPLTANSFEAGGQKFIIHSSVNIDLYAVMDELQIRGRFGKSYVQLHNGFVKWVELKNAGKGFDADVHIRNVFEGVARGANKQNDPIILICTLFMWPEGADRTKWDEESANEKIRVWSEEGYPVEDFMNWGLLFIRRYQSGSIVDSLNTLEEQSVETD